MTTGVEIRQRYEPPQLRGDYLWEAAVRCVSDAIKDAAREAVMQPDATGNTIEGMMRAANLVRAMPRPRDWP